MNNMPIWARRTLAGLLVVVGAYLLVEVVRSLLLVVSVRTRWQPGLAITHWYNKKIGNPIALRFQRKQVTVVHHIGRNSGREYVTPVWAEPVEDSFLIHLPYGAGVDWCRNVLNAGGCTIEHGGVSFDITAPTIVPAAEALAIVPERMRKMDQLMAVESYLRLDVIPAPAEAS